MGFTFILFFFFFFYLFFFFVVNFVIHWNETSLIVPGSSLLHCEDAIAWGTMVTNFISLKRVFNTCTVQLVKEVFKLHFEEPKLTWGTRKVQSEIKGFCTCFTYFYKQFDLDPQISTQDRRETLAHTLLLVVCLYYFEGFPGSSDCKESACMWETWVWSLGREDPLEKAKATQISILA